MAPVLLCSDVGGPLSKPIPVCCIKKTSDQLVCQIPFDGLKLNNARVNRRLPSNQAFVSFASLVNMGNQSARAKQRARRSAQGDQNGTACKNYVKKTPERRPQFNEHHKALVAESWKFIQLEMARVGVVTFIGLFETHPDVKDTFMPFKGVSIDDLPQSAELRAHALRVMATVEKVLGRINDMDKLSDLLHALGKKHVGYGAPAEFIELVGPQFIYAIKPSLAEHWSNEVEEAWMQLFRLIAHLMQEGMMKELEGK